MADYLSPGVYVEEYDNSPRGMEGVGTSTAGFVGMAEKGATAGPPVLVTGFGDFTRNYGGVLKRVHPWRIPLSCRRGGAVFRKWRHTLLYRPCHPGRCEGRRRDGRERDGIGKE